MTEKRRAVFLDRDGTINEQMGYINHISRFELLPGAAEAVRRLNDAGLPVIVISNQSGVARGYFPVELVEEVHRRMADELAIYKARLDGVYYCPHHPRGAVDEYRMECTCRKPGLGMIEKAAVEHHVDPARSYVVGDRLTDLETAAAAGAKGVLVLTGYGRGEAQYLLPRSSVRPDYVAEDLAGAADYILADLETG